MKNAEGKVDKSKSSGEKLRKQKTEKKDNPRESIRHIKS
jgi:hypothetical protein